MFALRKPKCEVVLHVGGSAVAAKGILGDLNPLGDSSRRSLANSGARVPKILPTAELEVFLTGLIVAMPPFLCRLIVGGFYSENACLNQLVLTFCINSTPVGEWESYGLFLANDGKPVASPDWVRACLFRSFFYKQ